MTPSDLDTFLFRLYFENDIKSKYEIGIKELFSICENSNQINLVKHIVEKMTVLSATQIEYALKTIANEITENSKGKKTAVVAISMDGDADSSQLMAQQMKPLFHNEGNISIFNGIIPYAKRMRDFEKCFLIDEFSGTGKTIISRINHIKNEMKNKSVTLETKVYLIAAMKPAIEKIENESIDLYTFLEIEPGISGHFSNDEMIERLHLMRELEDHLAAHHHGKPMPSLGYGYAEATYCTHSWNAPNSNFPLLWWPKAASGKDRNVVFRRHSP